MRYLRLLFWLLVTAAVPGALMLLTSQRWRGEIFAETYGVSLLFGTLIGLPANFLIPKLMGRCGNWSTPRRVAIFAATLFALTTVGTAVGVLLLIAIGYVPMSEFGSWMRGSYRWALFLSVCIGIVTYGYGHLRHQLDETNEKLRARELEEQRTRRLAADAKVAALESRIHPHFLFNALNAVSSLIREDPARAELLLERVAALLRFSLYEPQGGLVTLEKELQMTGDYLEIESVRFGERLRYRIEPLPELGAVQIPPLAIQTLVENSVKYAITNRREGGEVVVRVRRREGAAAVEVTDTGPGFDPSALPTGHGLDLLAARLDAQFAQGAGLDFERGEQSMTVRLRLPLESAA